MDFYIVLIFLLGLCLGSFLNVIIYRWAEGLSIISPLFSICPKCGHTLKWHHNIPLLSYIFLKGRCAFCKEKISIRYPFVELITAVGLTYIYLKFQPLYGWISFLGFSFYFLVLIAISFIDLKTKEIPDKLSLSLILAGWFFSLLGFNPLIDFKTSLLSGFSGAGLLFLINEFYYQITKRDGIGIGDFKLMGGIGAFLGYSSFYTILLLASIIGILVFLITKLFKKDTEKIDLKTEIPFGPFLALASLFYLFNWIRISLY